MQKSRLKFGIKYFLLYICKNKKNMINKESDFITNFIRTIGADKVFKSLTHRWELLKKKK